MEYTIREMTVTEYPLLNEFLYEAIFIPDGIKPPPKNIIASPELQIYVDRFGASKADFALVAEVEEKIVGAVWVRIMYDYGHIDDETPSFAISYTDLLSAYAFVEPSFNVIIIMLSPLFFSLLSAVSPHAMRQPSQLPWQRSVTANAKARLL